MTSFQPVGITPEQLSRFARLKSCEQCDISNGNMLRCSGCSYFIYYCSATCQKAHWPKHKADCKMLKRELDISDVHERAVYELRSAKSIVEARVALTTMISSLSARPHDSPPSIAQSKFLATGAFHAVVPMLRNHIDDADFIYTGLRFLFAMIHGSHDLFQSFTDKLSMLGGGELVVDILRVHLNCRFGLQYFVFSDSYQQEIISQKSTNDHQQSTSSGESRRGASFSGNSTILQ